MKAIVPVILVLSLDIVGAQSRPPILDMHMHALAADDQGPPPVPMCVPSPEYPAWDPRTSYERVLATPLCPNPIQSTPTDDGLMTATLAIAERYNIIGVVSGAPERVARWAKANPRRVIRALSFQLGDAGTPSPATLRRMHAAGELQVLGEVTNQYAGIMPDDARMEPYWTVAEELDIPVGIHMGPGPPGVTYLGATRYRASMDSALTIEEVLVKHPRLRVYIMHAGYPLLDDLLAVLYAHPQVYVDIGIIVYNQPRAAFYRYLQAIVDAGFAKRVMFGSDQMVWPETIELAIGVINDAPFLTVAQRRDIFYNNAARFLRLSDEEIARHRSH